MLWMMDGLTTSCGQGSNLFESAWLNLIRMGTQLADQRIPSRLCKWRQSGVVIKPAG